MGHKESDTTLRLNSNNKSYPRVFGLNTASAVVKNLPAKARDRRDTGSFPGLERSPGIRNGYSLQYFLPGKFHGQRSLVGYNPWGLKESDNTERAHAHTHRGNQYRPAADASPVSVK